MPYPIGTDPAVFGRDIGPKPNRLVLATLPRCGEMDVVMRIEPENRSVPADAQRTEVHPNVIRA